MEEQNPRAARGWIRHPGHQVIQGGDVEAGRPTPRSGDTEIALGQLVDLCFNSDTMWQQ